MSPDRWMDKEVVVHLYNGILLSHKKEQTWVNCSEGKSKSEREKQVSYINAFMWNWEIWTDEPSTEYTASSLRQFCGLDALKSWHWTMQVRES